MFTVEARALCKRKLRKTVYQPPWNIGRHFFLPLLSLPLHNPACFLNSRCYVVAMNVCLRTSLAQGLQKIDWSIIFTRDWSFNMATVEASTWRLWKLQHGDCGSLVWRYLTVITVCAHSIVISAENLTFISLPWILNFVSRGYCLRRRTRMARFDGSQLLIMRC
jgi:hypothetical protein